MVLSPHGPPLWTSRLNSQMLGGCVVEQTFHIVGCRAQQEDWREYVELEV